MCVLVTKNVPCMGPVTQAGCGALCPSIGRACYACYGPKDNVNADSLSQQFAQQGMSFDAIRRRFLFINSQTPVFKNIDGILARRKQAVEIDPTNKK